MLSMSCCLYNKKNITQRLEDMNFIFSWQKQYFTHLLFCHSKIKFISSRHRVISSMYIMVFWQHLVVNWSGRDSASGLTHITDHVLFVSFMGYFIFFYYIDTSVLLENIPLGKFIKTTSGTREVYFP